MNEEQIGALLQTADRSAGPPVYGRPTAAGIRRRVGHWRAVRTRVPALAAAVLLIATVLWAICLRTQQKPQPEPLPEPQRIASLETQVKELQAQTDATLKLVREVLERDRQERRLAALQAELASIPDPLREIEARVDKTAFLLLYQADRLYKELNQTESAVAQYREVIQLFPKNRWADVARERLSEIEQHPINKSETEGETRCEPRNV